ncbi:NADP-dependent 3-hydroxy acid dehydrogenase YdfG [Thalassovita litoralis]|uniref:NADP-dependent 3-hydroxy acid dehydrogenase YdfG n=1 Tax=Thalassovita litoralis TaxID=1010611 RepID=A0A521F540_9RHOB|nr:SDR family NAD(P)-dependent oxidoreductase [Thalassovita litoralis]SMO90630.1 NADP-dependent 3-hydroxy acid dehydrogenase YdfG [Thalassovita litoralis]
MTKVVFVTGAATGIGRATVERLHRKGCKLALFDINKPELDALAAQLGGDILTIEGSVRDMAGLQAAADKTAAHFGRIDVVWANAGIARAKPLMLAEEDEWLQVIDINLNGVFRTLRATATYLRDSAGYVLITSSISSTVALPFAGSYVASKAAVLNLAESFRGEMYGWGVEVGTIHPTFIRTPLIDGAIYEDTYGGLIQSTSKLLFFEFPLSWAAWTAERMIMGRKRRNTVPAWTHMPFIWFPRFGNWFAQVWGFRRKAMRRVMEAAIRHHEGRG